MYFQDESRNASYRLFDPELVMAMGGDANGKTGRFDFVLKTS
jgi:hypothetical protein